MPYAPSWPHVSVSASPSLRELNALLVLWRADKPHRFTKQMTATGSTDWPHSGYLARECRCGNVFIVGRGIFDQQCGRCRSQ